MRRTLELAELAGRFLENLLLGCLLIGMVLLACAQVLLRDFGFGSIVWGDEAVRLMVLWIAIIAGIAAAREDRHISIDVLSRFLSPRMQALTGIVVAIFTASVCAAIAWYGYDMVAFAIEDDEIVLTGLPAWVFQAIIPLGFALIAWRYSVISVRQVHALLVAGHRS